MACKVSARSMSVSPMPTNKPVVKGIDNRPASVSVLADHRILVRAAVVGQTLCLVQTLRRRLEHHAHRGELPAGAWPSPPNSSPRDSGGAAAQSPSSTRIAIAAHSPESSRSPLRQPIRRLGPARLRPVAKSEKRFLAAEFRSTGGEFDDLTGLRVHAPPGGRNLPGTVTKVQ